MIKRKEDKSIIIKALRLIAVEMLSNDANHMTLEIEHGMLKLDFDIVLTEIGVVEK